MTVLPAIVIGGYLGAGKTTLVNHLLRHADGRRLAVLVNDFGETAIDASLVQGADGEVLALAGGCLCCSYGADLVGTLQQVLRRDPPPDLLLVECSGVALPGAAARAAALVPGLVVEGVAVVLDLADLSRRAADPYVGELVRQQLGQADLLLANQADRAGPAARMAAEALLQRQAPGVPWVACRHAEVPAEVVLGLHPADVARDTRATPGRLQAPSPPAAARFRYFTRRVAGAADPQALAGELAGANLLRAKGWVRGTDGRAWRVQAMGARVQVEPAAEPPVPWIGTIACIARAE